ncbi:MAG: type II toxin-antitoxin system RelE/ParE family toxin [Candidatus Woesearchaeota archaeon]|nr:MAG: type II toxin-antitoxin system RelE/ParE family toxin [Candidatus Woesearchaeota archaeon]
MREHEYSDHLKRILNKLYKKDRPRYEEVMKKIEEILKSQNPDHYKNLRYDMKDSKRVHIGHFVLVFRVVGDKIYFDDFDHHDNIY